MPDLAPTREAAAAAIGSRATTAQGDGPVARCAAGPGKPSVPPHAGCTDAPAQGRFEEQKTGTAAVAPANGALPSPAAPTGAADLSADSRGQPAPGAVAPVTEETLAAARALARDAHERVDAALHGAALTSGKYTYATHTWGESLPVVDRRDQQVGVNAHTVDALHTVGDRDDPGYFWWGLNRIGTDFMLGAPGSHDGPQGGLMGFVHNQFYGLGPLYGVDTDRGGLLLGGYLGGASGFLGPGAYAKYTDEGGWAVAGGAYLFASGDTKIKRLGPYVGKDPELVGKEHLEVSKSYTVGGFAGASAGIGWVGGGIRIAPSYGEHVLYRTHVDPATADVAGKVNDGAVGFMRRKLTAFGLRETPVVIADPTHPETLRKGDELQWTTTHSLGVSVAGAAYGVRCGPHGVLAGEFAVSVRRINDDHIEVVVAPTQGKALSLRADAALAVEASFTKTQSESLRQCFLFDLRSDEARAAYDGLIQDAELPGKLRLERPEGASGSEELSAYVNFEQLPVGVTRRYAARSKRAGRSFDAGIHKFWCLPNSSTIAGIGPRMADFEETHVVAGRDGCLIVDIQSAKRESQRFTAGSYEHSTCSERMGSVRFNPDDATFEGLTLAAGFSYTRTKGFERDALVTTLGRAFHKKIGHFRRRAHGQSYHVRVGMALTDLDVHALGILRPQSVHAVCEQLGYARHGAETVALLRLAQALQEVPVGPIDRDTGERRSRRSAVMLERRSRILQDFLDKQGVWIIPAIDRLVPRESSRVTVSVESTSYDEPVAGAKALIAELESADEREKDALRRKLSEQTKRAERDLRRGLRDLYDDWLVWALDRKTWNRHCVALETATDALSRVVAKHGEFASGSFAAKSLDKDKLIARASRLARKYEHVPLSSYKRPSDLTRRLLALHELSRDIECAITKYQEGMPLLEGVRLTRRWRQWQQRIDELCDIRQLTNHQRLALVAARRQRKLPRMPTSRSQILDQLAYR